MASSVNGKSKTGFWYFAERAFMLLVLPFMFVFGFCTGAKKETYERYFKACMFNK